MRYLVLFMLLSALAYQPVHGQANPFLEEWDTPFGIAPFDRIQDDHFMPAFREGIEQQRRELAAITSNPEAPTIANTLEALDQSGELLRKVGGVFYNYLSAVSSDERQAIAREVAPMMSALEDDILLDAKLFARIKALYDDRAELGLDAEQKRLLEETYKRFVRGGANLSDADKQRLRAINEQLSVMSLRFSDNVLKETNAYRLVIDDRADLAGLPDHVVSAAADQAREDGMDGKWFFTLQAPSIWPFLTYADNRDLRREILTAYIMRGDNGNEQDNKALIAQIAGLRAERAKLLGYPTHAHFVLEERMAKTPEAVYGLLDQIWKPALDLARREADALQAMIEQEGGDFELEPWDWRYYAEKVKKEQFDLDEAELQPYFPLDQVREGAFYVANRLYGISFEERSDIPTYHPEVKAFEVKDADGSHLGVFLVDYHPRASKRGGAWQSEFRGQYHLNGENIRPIAVNVANFTRPTGDTPALLRVEEVETLFHEFGHALHALFSQVRYPGVGGVPRDFVELPSQIMEHWATEPEVLRVFGRHWKTGEVIPDELIEKIEKAGKFNQGFATVEYMAASYLDLDWHTRVDGIVADVNAFEKASLDRIGLMDEIVTRYRTPYFLHIFSHGYSAGYYSYIWSEVLDSDAFQAFKEKGIFDRETATSFRKNILEKAGSADAEEMYVDFRGRKPSVEPLLENRGLK